VVAGMNGFVRVCFAFNLENIDIGILLLKILANEAKSGPKMFCITQNISHLRYCISKIPVTVSFSSDSIVALHFIMFCFSWHDGETKVQFTTVLEIDERLYSLGKDSIKSTDEAFLWKVSFVILIFVVVLIFRFFAYFLATIPWDTK
jgi:hypothetical protein